MEPRAHHVIIGLFTVSAFAATLVVALWLGSPSADRDWAYYQIGFDEAVSGLSAGNPVLYSGVQVGDVVELKLNPQDPRQVWVLVRVDQQIPIRENTQVGLVLANITGSMSIQFTGGSPDNPALRGDRDNPPLILAEPSPFTSLLSNGEQLLERANDLLNNANQVFSGRNADNLSQILANTREASDGLMERRQEILDLLERLDSAAIRAQEAALKVSRVSDNTNELLTNEGKTVLMAMSQALNSIQVTSSRINQLTQDNEGAMNAGFQGMAQLGPALRELRTTLRGLNQFTRRLEQDPAGVLWGTDTIRGISQ